jgi:hypothetical protein
MTFFETNFARASFTHGLFPCLSFAFQVQPGSGNLVGFPDDACTITGGKQHARSRVGNQLVGPDHGDDGGAGGRQTDPAGKQASQECDDQGNGHIDQQWHLMHLGLSRFRQLI